jgi:hypothetical protein
MKVITITIDTEGKASADLTGYAGQGCARDLHDLTAGLGNMTVHATKQEYYQTTPTTQKQGSGGCGKC